MKSLLFLGIVLLLPILSAQDRPQEQIGTPREAPDPTRPLPKHPLELFNEILSDTREVRERSLVALVGDLLHPTDFAEIPDSQIRAVQLDEDPELEFVLIFHQVPWASHVLIADKGPQTWNLVGQFHYYWHWDWRTAEKIAEVHSPFVLVRDATGGSCMYQNPASLYRLLNGKLYKTIEILEADYHCVVGTPTSVTTNKHIQFRREHFSPWMAIEVRTEQTTSRFDKSQWIEQPSVGGETCEGYEWIPESFTFELTDKATQALCQ